MKRLQLNYQKLFEEYQKFVEETCDLVLEEYFAEISFQMKTDKGKNDLTTISQEEKMILKRGVIGGAWAILDSFGSGSKMDTGNLQLQAYIQSPNYNPLRRSKGTTAILGRPAGEYENIFGEREVSSGKAAGRNLEQIKKDGEPIVEVIEPSYAFQQAWKWLVAGKRIHKRLEEMNKNFFKQVKNNSSSFFVYGG